MQRFAMTICALWLACAGWAQEVLTPVPDIEEVIQHQVEAFLEDDVERAFEFASPTIQRLFGGAENFGAMVRNGYPMVWRPQSVAFGDLRNVGGALWQRVLITDAAGRLHRLDYQMRQIDGAWRINAVQLLQADDVSA